MLLSAPPEVVARHRDRILDTVEWLLAIQQPSGNWPHKASRHMPAAEEPEEDQLCQCVHPGPCIPRVPHASSLSPE